MRRVLAVAIAAVVAFLLLGACLGKSDPLPFGARRRAARTTSTSSTLPPEVKVAPASVAVESMEVDAPGFPDPVRDAVVGTLNAWVSAGVVQPLLTGQPAVGLDSVFTPVALERLGGGTPDRAAMVEEASSGGVVQPERAAATLTGLAGERGELGLVAAGIDVSVLFVRADGTRVRIARTGDVVLVPIGGGWRIDSYDVVTKRDTVPR